MLKILQCLLCCPDCHGDLEWKIETETERGIVSADATCEYCNRNYVIRDKVATFLLTETSGNDLWKIVDSHLAKELKKNPKYEKQLMQSDLSSLNAADKFLRAAIHDERGNYNLAKTTRRLAVEELYAPSFNRQYDTKKKELQNLLAGEDGLVVDLASGMAGLAKVFSTLENPVVFSDISPTILLRNQLRLEHFGLYDKVSLIAFDVKKMPFAESSVPVFTSNLGLTNIRDSASFAMELSRCLKDRAYFITFFYPDNGDQNAQLLEELGMNLGFETRLEQIAEQYFDVQILHPAQADIEPTAESEIFNIGIDGLPVEPTTITWAIVKLEPKS
ncbi:MAG: methyltransferase domain-containing protein [Candidatus Lokiarchaeota archaeon]|nr:methyltransferase domain-containing protein [Candidatus Lokiarchaeota archaeon]